MRFAKVNKVILDLVKNRSSVAGISPLARFVRSPAHLHEPDISLQHCREVLVLAAQPRYFDR